MKYIKIAFSILIVMALIVTVDMVSLLSFSEQNAQSDLVDTNVFPHDKVITVSITIDEDDYAEMLANPLAEEYYRADVNYNRYSFNSIAVRTKGNSSLNHVAKSDSIRYSLKLDLDYYVNDQSLFGVSNINLNNIYVDNTMMAEYISYEMVRELGANAPRTSYTALYINGEYFGLFLSVEQVDESFLLSNYGNANGELYKPYRGSGCDLQYTTDDGESYTGLQIKNNVSSNNSELVEFMKIIQEQGNLDEVLNVDSFLKYLAMSVATAHLDCYQGGMFHNYYLYNNNGKFEWITWDLNMAFGGFPKAPAQPQIFDFLIDEPVLGSMSNYPLIQAIFSNEEYVNKYHSYLQEIVDNYYDPTYFENRVLDTYQMIKDYVKTDPTAFYSYEEFETALFKDTDTEVSLLNFAKYSRENIISQLNGEKVSTNNGNGNSGGKNKQGNLLGLKEPKEGEQTNTQQQGSKPAINGAVNKPFSFDQNGNVVLPEGISLSDLPESLRQYLEKGELPPKQEMPQILQDLSLEIKEKLGLNSMPTENKNGQTNNTEVKPTKENNATTNTQPQGNKSTMGGSEKMPFSFDENGKIVLPAGISLSDLPESLRQYLEKGELPPKQVMPQILQDLSPELKDKLGLSDMPSNDKNNQGNTGEIPAKGNKQTANGKQGNKPAMGGELKIPFNFDENGNVVLPEGITMEDLPESLRQYLEKGELPPREAMTQIMQELSPEVKAKLGLNEAPSKDRTENNQTDYNSLVPNLILMAFGTLGLIVIAVILRKR